MTCYQLITLSSSYSSDSYFNESTKIVYQRHYIEITLKILAISSKEPKKSPCGFKKLFKRYKISKVAFAIFEKGNEPYFGNKKRAKEKSKNILVKIKFKTS